MVGGHFCNLNFFTDDFFQGVDIPTGVQVLIQIFNHLLCADHGVILLSLDKDWYQILRSASESDRWRTEFDLFRSRSGDVVDVFELGLKLGPYIVQVYTDTPRLA